MENKKHILFFQIHLKQRKNTNLNIAIIANFLLIQNQGPFQACDYKAWVEE